MVSRPLLAAVLAWTAGCGSAPEQEASAGDAAAPAVAFDEPVIVDEAWISAPDPGNLDSPAVWHAPDGAVLVFMSAKSADEVLVYDGATGELVRRLEGGAEPALAFDYPNGVAVVDSMLLVVGRDRDRVQAFALPSLAALGAFGDDVLRTPYGIAALPAADGAAIDVWVTDQHDPLPAPADSAGLLASRVKRFVLRRTPTGIEAELVRAFGDTAGPGALRQVESIAVDPADRRLLLADEADAEVVVYGADERWAETLPIHFVGDAEGIALYECGAGGWWVLTDQGPERNVFHVLERRSLRRVGAFTGAATVMTDGIAVTARPVGAMSRGALFAAHSDAHLVAFDWRAIADAVGLDLDCPAP